MKIAVLLLMAVCCACGKNQDTAGTSGGGSSSGGGASNGGGGSGGSTGSVNPDSAPTIVSITPDASTTLGGTTALTIVFSLPMDETSVQFAGDLGSAAAVAWSSATSVTLTPTATWPNSSSVSDLKTLTISGNGTNQRALAAISYSYLVDATLPTIGASPPDGASIDWAQTITITSDKSLSDFEVSGSLADAIGFTHAINAVTLTLTPSPTWNDDSNETLIITVKDANGNASAPLALTYTVFAGGVYVNQTDSRASDSNIGTRSEPLVSIGGGFTALGGLTALYPASGPAAVRIAEATYTEALTVPANVQLIGGYSASDWNATPSRSNHVTTIASSAPSGTTLTLSEGSHLQRLTIISPSVSAGYCTAVLADASGSTPIVLDDNALEALDCAPPIAGSTFGGNALYVVGTTPVMLTNNDLVVDNQSVATASGLLFNGAVLAINGGTIIAGNSPTQQSIAIEDNAGALTLENAIVAAGTAPGGTGALEAQMAGVTSIDIEGSTLYGGDCTSEDSEGIFLAGASTATVTILGNYIDGGASSKAAGFVSGIRASGGDILIANNVISTSDTPGPGSECAGIRLDTSNVRIYNNTIHAGLCPSLTSAIFLNDSGAKIENNLLFFYKSPTGNLIHEFSGGSAPASLLSNVFWDFDNSATHGAYKKNGVATAVGFDDTALNTAAKTITGAAGNSVDDPRLKDLDASAGANYSFFGASYSIANDWSLPSDSAVRSIGVDGSATYGFTTDITGATRTADGTSGWSPGAYEQD